MRRTSVRLLPAMAACLLSHALAAGFDPAQLPGLPAGIGPAGLQQPAPVVTWQLHQELSLQPTNGDMRLDLSPGMTFVLHDAASDIQTGLNALASQVQALEESLHKDEMSLGLHRDALLLQQQHYLADFYREWLASVPGTGTADPDREQQNLAARVALRQAEALRRIEELELRLQAGGVQLTGLEGGGYFRPWLQLSAEPLAQCLAGSRSLARLELLADVELQSAALEQAERKLRVELTTGLNVGLAGAGEAGPSFGWNLGLSVRRGDYAGPQLRLDASAHRVAQSMTIRGPEAKPPAVESGNDAWQQAIVHESIRLRTLLADLEIAAAWEQLLREELQLLLTGQESAQSDGTDVIDGVTALTQAALQYDFLLLQAAVDCGARLGYAQVEEYP